MLQLPWVVSLVLYSAANAGWVEKAVVDGVRLESQAVPGSDFRRYRVSAEYSIPVEIFAKAVWGTSSAEDVVSSYIQQHDVLEESDVQRIYYEVVGAPMVTDRDYVLMFQRSPLGKGWRIESKSIDDKRVPLQANRVRMNIESQCDIQPSAKGTRVVYELFTDLRGSMPAWMAAGPQEQAIVEWLKTMKTRAAELQRRQDKTASLD